MDIFGRCNGPGSGGTTLTGAASGVGTSIRTGTVVPAIATATATVADSTASVSASESALGPGSANRMQLTGASAPGTAASPESGVSPLADAYSKMTTDILTERTLGDFVSEHPGELVKTGKFGHYWIRFS